MNQPSVRRLAVLLIAGFCAPGVQAKPETETAPSVQVAVQLREGRLSLEARNVALGRVVQALEARAGVQFSFHDALDERAPLTLSFWNQPLREGIRAVLEGHSYFISEPSGAVGLRVTVLSSASAEAAPDPTTPPTSGPKTAGAGDGTQPPPESVDATPLEMEPVISFDIMEPGSGWVFDPP